MRKREKKREKEREEERVLCSSTFFHLLLVHRSFVTLCRIPSSAVFVMETKTYVLGNGLRRDKKKNLLSTLNCDVMDIRHKSHLIQKLYRY